MQDVTSVVVMLLPFLVIIWLANLADHQREREKPDAGLVLAILTYVILGLLLVGFIAVGLLLQALGAMAHGTLPPQLAQTYRQMGIDPASIAAALPKVGLGLWLPSLIGLILLLPPVRRLLSRVLPIDPLRTVHAVALSFTMLILMNMLFFLGIGLGNMASLLQAGAQAGSAYNPAPGIWAQDVMLFFMGVVGVGWLGRRPLGAALARLGIVVPGWRRVGLGIVIALAMVPVALAIEYLASRYGFGENADVNRLSEQLIGPLAKSIPGILTMGLAAALGEETIFRGALQPRFGLVLTAALFALLHSQYGISIATVVVLIIGLVLGVVRQRANTTTSMVVHAVYNMTLGLLSFLNIGNF